MSVQIQKALRKGLEFGVHHIAKPLGVAFVPVLSASGQVASSKLASEEDINTLPEIVQKSFVFIWVLEKI